MFVRLSVICLPLCFFGFGLLASPSQDRLNLYYGIAEGNYFIGDLRGAERSIEQMLRIAPDYVPALTLQARVHLDQKNSDAALETAERLIELEPDNPEHQKLKAHILGQKERGDAAYLEKARSALQSDQPKAAIAVLDQAIEAYQDQDGREALQRATALRLNRARLLAQLGEAEAAVDDLQTLIGQQPENFEAVITLASIYASLGRWASLEDLIPSIAARPELRDVALYLDGRSALAKDRVGTARSKFETALEALPEHADNLRRSLHFYRGVCLGRLDRRDEAQTAILQAVDAGFRPETSEEAVIASRALLRSDRPADAIPLLEAITLNRITPDARVWAMLGRAHRATDTPTLALSAFNESLKIDPRQAATRALRGSLLRQIGDLEGALADYQSARQLRPEDPALAYAAGLVHLQLGKIPEAEEALADAAPLFQGRPGVALLHALLAHSTEQHESARASLRIYQDQTAEKPNPTAYYLDHLLNGSPVEAPGNDPIARYYSGRDDRKAALDTAGIAETPEQARQQICTTAFWLAQFESQNKRPESARELLRIALDTGHPDLPEFQLARWQFDQSEP